MTLDEAASFLNATPADLPGLWNAPSYPELTSPQLVQAALQRQRPSVDYRDTAAALFTPATTPPA